MQNAFHQNYPGFIVDILPRIWLQLINTQYVKNLFFTEFSATGQVIWLQEGSVLSKYKLLILTLNIGLAEWMFKPEFSCKSTYSHGFFRACHAASLYYPALNIIIIGNLEGSILAVICCCYAWYEDWRSNAAA